MYIFLCELYFFRSQFIYLVENASPLIHFLQCSRLSVLKFKLLTF